jgi:hypothetical protein
VPTFQKIHDALTADGIFFLTTPDADEWGRQTKYYSHLKDLPAASSSAHFIDDHVWIYNKKELMQIFSDSGFEVVQFAYARGVGHRHFNVALRRKN